MIDRGKIMCCDCCDHVNWEDYFESVVEIIKAGGPMAEVMKRRVEKDLEETMSSLIFLMKWMEDKDEGKGRTVKFMKYAPLNKLEGK